MKMHIVVIRDIKANVYAQPQFVASIGGFVRGFGDECQRDAPDNIMSKHPEDFEAYDLGWYGDGDAHFELHKEPKQIAVGSNYKR
jgi:hypothetical protein